MDKLFVNFELSMVLKQLKFNTPCFRYYSIAGNLCENNLFTFYQNSMGGKIDSHIAAPLYQQVIDWFREKHNIVINVMLYYKVDKGSWSFELEEYGSHETYKDISKYDKHKTYYESLNKAIEEAIKLI